MKTPKLRMEMIAWVEEHVIPKMQEKFGEVVSNHSGVKLARLLDRAIESPGVETWRMIRQQLNFARLNRQMFTHPAEIAANSIKVIYETDSEEAVYRWLLNAVSKINEFIGMEDPKYASGVTPLEIPDWITYEFLSEGEKRDLRRKHDMLQLKEDMVRWMETHVIRAIQLKLLGVAVPRLEEEHIHFSDLIDKRLLTYEGKLDVPTFDWQAFKALMIDLDKGIEPEAKSSFTRHASMFDRIHEIYQDQDPVSAAVKLGALVEMVNAFLTDCDLSVPGAMRSLWTNIGNLLDPIQLPETFDDEEEDEVV